MICHLLLVLLICTTGVTFSTPLYKDSTQPIDSRVDSLISLMTLPEKIGQMTQLDRENLTADVVIGYNIGSVLSSGDSWPGGKANASAREWVEMVNAFQEWALTTRLGIPMLYGIDAIHGHNTVYGATVFPHNIGLGATRDPELVRRIGAATALETRATGIPYSFAPCIAVCRDPRWGRCYESYSEDHKIVQEMTSIIDGLQGEIPASSQKGIPYLGGKDKVLGCAKHYVGDGGTVKGINEADTIIDWKSLLDIHMPAYLDAIEKGVGTIMASYSSWNGVKMHANHDLLTKYLKDTLNFKGFIISDEGGVDRISANYTYSIEASILSGIDMVMVPYLYDEFIGNLTMLVEKNVVPISRIDDAVRRILRVKFTLGLFENPYADLSLAKHLGSQAHRELAREAVRKSLVLLKNGKEREGPLLPLPRKTSRILVAGSHAHNLGYQCGGWTITWQGQGGNNITIGTTILDAIKSTVDPTTQIVYQDNVTPDFVNSKDFSYAIVVVGEQPYAETKGDNLSLEIPLGGETTIRYGRARCIRCAFWGL